MGKPKKVIFQLIDPNEKPEPVPYILLRDIRSEQHFETSKAKIALAWQKGIKPDIDGHVLLGKCVKATDLQRELIDLDFVILLNREIWEDPGFGDSRRLALLDHELSHAARATDADGDPQIDMKGRPVWRTRKHDIEEFQGVVERHGCYKRDLEKFADALAKKKKSPLFSADEAAERLSVDPNFLDAADRMTSSIRNGGVKKMTFSSNGMEPIVIDKEAAQNIHERAKNAKKK